MKSHGHGFLFAATLAMLCLLGGHAWGQSPAQRLKSFGTAGLAGGFPVGLLAGADGVLYGTTQAGQTGSAGTVFKVNPDGSGYTILHLFNTNGADGQTPLAGVIVGRDGLLYGTTSAGGSNQLGTVFKLARDGSSYSVIHHFGNFWYDGQTPQARLLQGADGSLYGTAMNGGSNFVGTVFRLDVNGQNYTNLYHFAGDPSDGSYPTAGLIQGVDGLLYGTTFGISGLSGGTVFRMTTNGTGYTQLHSFGTGTDGSQPYDLVQGANGMLYGTTQFGGTNQDQYGVAHGTIFRVNTNGLGYAMLHGFNGLTGDGAEPHAGMILGKDGALYGTTWHGGSQYDDGVVFRIETDGTGYQVIRRFVVITSILSLFSTDGAQPGPLVQGTDGVLYGATYYGGTTGQGGYDATGLGTLFMLTTDSNDYGVIYNFSTSGGDGANPAAGLVQAGDGSFYGTTQSGGLGGHGTIFKIKSDGTGYSVTYGFGLSQIAGQTPKAAMIEGRDGMLYGTTAEGGYGGTGMAFKVRPDGTFLTLLHSFGNIGEDGETPMAPLLQGRDGGMYGTTAGGGHIAPYYGGYGTVFRFDTNASTYAILHYFNTNGVEGEKPGAGLIQATDGALYGLTYGGPQYGGFGQYYGNIFKLFTNGAGFQVLHNFTNNGTEGTFPDAALIQGEDGALYGTTTAGGSNNLQGGNFGGSGIVFKMNLNGTGYQILHQFGATATDGQNPAGSLIQGSDGALYGATTAGGLYTNRFGQGYGTVFKLNTNGTGYNIVYNFGGNYGKNQYPQDGVTPQGALVQGSDGALYGVTAAGGDLDLGTIFRIGSLPFQFTSISRLADKTVNLSLLGASNAPCRVDVSTNLVNWSTLTNLVNTNGTVQFKDVSAPNFSRRFYRAYQGP
jgi:uncharacterized repeat protein (TIGR03803 family)